MQIVSNTFNCNIKQAQLKIAKEAVLGLMAQFGLLIRHNGGTGWVCLFYYLFIIFLFFSFSLNINSKIGFIFFFYFYIYIYIWSPVSISSVCCQCRYWNKQVIIKKFDIFLNLCQKISNIAVYKRFLYIYEQLN